MKRMRQLLTGLLLASLTSNVFAIVEVRKWEPFEIRFVANNVYENPYVQAMPYNGDALLKVVFTGISGDAAGRTYTIEGFWDGNWS